MNCKIRDSGRTIFVTRSLLTEVTVVFARVFAKAHQYLTNSTGSIQSIDAIPIELRNTYKTVWDIDQEVLVQMAADRGPFICQSQSLSLYLQSPTVSRVVSGLRKCCDGGF